MSWRSRRDTLANSTLSPRAGAILEENTSAVARDNLSAIYQTSRQNASTFAALTTRKSCRANGGKLWMPTLLLPSSKYDYISILLVLHPNLTDGKQDYCISHRRSGCCCYGIFAHFFPDEFCRPEETDSWANRIDLVATVQIEKSEPISLAGFNTNSCIISPPKNVLPMCDCAQCLSQTTSQLNICI